MFAKYEWRRKSNQSILNGQGSWPKVKRRIISNLRFLKNINI